MEQCLSRLRSTLLVAEALGSLQQHPCLALMLINHWDHSERLLGETVVLIRPSVFERHRLIPVCLSPSNWGCV